MSKHPNPSRLREMAYKFETIHASNEIRPIVDFCYYQVIKTSCGTVACHGGWAGVALSDSDCKDFGIGIDLLNEFLGLYRFDSWAHKYPTLWGNIEGAAMFGSRGWLAFGFIEDNKHECTLLAIAKHYREVADRIEALGEIK